MHPGGYSKYVFSTPTLLVGPLETSASFTVVQKSENHILYTDEFPLIDQCNNMQSSVTTQYLHSPSGDELEAVIHQWILWTTRIVNWDWSARLGWSEMQHTSCRLKVGIYLITLIAGWYDGKYVPRWSGGMCQILRMTGLKCADHKVTGLSQALRTGCSGDLGTGVADQGSLPRYSAGRRGHWEHRDDQAVGRIRCPCRLSEEACTRRTVVADDSEALP